eukprot:jgi/Tetstr1/439862/TSEL_028273.t1
MAAALRSPTCAVAGSRADPRPTGQLRVASGGFASRRPRGRAPTRGAAPSTRLAAARPETLEQEVQDEVVEAAPSLKELAAALDDAVAKEDYTAAAVLRDQLRAAEAADPVVSAQRALEASIREERYEDAARYRDLLAEIAPPPPPAPIEMPPGSMAITRGVRVLVESYFVPAHSMPAQGQYFFAYKVTIANEGDLTVQLRTRHWVITDAEGNEEQVKGPGVVGEQPILNPGTSFSYTSACPLKTEYGSMRGKYEMAVLDSETGEWFDSFDAEVAEFGLTVERELRQDEQDPHRHDRPQATRGGSVWLSMMVSKFNIEMSYDFDPA